MAIEYNPNNFTLINIDIESLIAAVEEKTGMAFFEDSYGNGVAVSGDGRSYSTYTELAFVNDIEIMYHAEEVSEEDTMTVRRAGPMSRS